jgi:hypothetical protein
VGPTSYLLTQELHHELELIGRANLGVIPPDVNRYRNIELTGRSANFPGAVWFMHVYDRLFLTTQWRTSQVENQFQSWVRCE